VAGALYHSLVLRDGLLRRMWFGKRMLRSSATVASARGQSLS
jgi:hypothetical protein